MSDKPRIQPVIMSGGAGTRLWPMSRAARPKQFAALTSGRTFFQETALRVAEGFPPPLVVAGMGHESLVAEQLAAIGVKPAGVIIEPEPRNTAAVAAVASEWALARAKESLLLLLPADHEVADGAGLVGAVKEAAPVAAAGRIVTFGVRPSRPHTGFGYIEQGAPIAGSLHAVAAFREKPEVETARRYVEGGRHFWNAGILLFEPETMLAEMRAYAPDIARAAAAALANARENEGGLVLDPLQFRACPSSSIDHAVLERTAKAVVAGPLEIGWSDVGSWSALGETGDQSVIVAIGTEGCVIRSEGPMVAALGVTDLIIVATGDAVLVAPKDRAEEVKNIVEALKARGRTDLL